MVYGYAACLILFLAALAGITLEKAYFYLPIRELERRAGKDDPVARQFLMVVRYGDELRLLLIVLSWVMATASAVAWVHFTPLAIGSVGVFIILVLAFFWQLRSPLSARGALLAAWCAPVLHVILSHCHQFLSMPAQLFKRFHLQRSHTGLYELADVAGFLERQQHQHDNRIDPGDLTRLRRALEAGKRTVGGLMTPQAQVQSVNSEDDISPVLQNELHQSGHARFPVYEGKRTNIVGTLKLGDIADVKRHGRVDDVTDRHLAYLRQDDTVEQAVRAFYETHQELFVVLDKQGQYAGILTLGSVLVYLFGSLDKLQFGHFDDREAVAHKAVAKGTTEVVK